MSGVVIRPSGVRTDTRESDIVRNVEALRQAETVRVGQRRAEADAAADTLQADHKLPRTFGQRLASPFVACFCPYRR